MQQQSLWTTHSEASQKIVKLRIWHPPDRGCQYPLLRSRASNLKVQLEADQSQLADKFQSTSTELDKTSRGLTLSLSADHTDELLGGGSSRADLLLRRGQLALGATAAAQDTAGTAGAFSKLNLNVQRQQNVSNDVSLTLQLSYQLAGKNLDSSEKMSMGGPATLPGYANGEASGDSGLQTKLSARWQLLPELALTAFTDYVRLKLAHDPVAGTTKNDKRLSATSALVLESNVSSTMGNPLRRTWRRNRPLGNVVIPICAPDCTQAQNP